ncbi:hypothetical protein EG240_02680 [Paenimyroides tangerinum]|uniref:TonB C-terminal domain-containing protein n=1 Tax=Paenimyroides tangerinum TaxID=2488728 RepID=A0A3P3WGI4_9FLAO|nr:hypothetical protein [Paenimyroides tangerinum]RRJ92709.1 hypothetical protein EG240_02680 [Paenimyroides tangerinum]
MKQFFMLLVFASSSFFNLNARTNSNLNEVNSSIRFLDDKIVLYYKDFDVYLDSFEFNNSTFNYVVDGNRNVLFFDEDGKQTTLDLQNFVLKNYSEKFSSLGMKSSSHALVYSKVLDAEKYDAIPEPLLFDKQELFSKITSAISSNSNFNEMPENTKGVTKFQFDIDENGMIVNAKYFSEVNIDGLDYVVKFLYGLDKWKPAQIDGKPVKSSYEVKLFSRYNSDIIPADEMSKIIKSLQ